VWGVLDARGDGEEVREEGLGRLERPRAVCEGLGWGDVVGDVVASAGLERAPWRIVGGRVLFLRPDHSRIGALVSRRESGRSLL